MSARLGGSSVVSRARSRRSRTMSDFDRPRRRDSASMSAASGSGRRTVRVFMSHACITLPCMAQYSSSSAPRHPACIDRRLALGRRQFERKLATHDQARRHALCALAHRLSAHRRGRTALFNWLYARHTGGKFLLRIEDTDRERSTEAAIDALLDRPQVAGLEWDGEPLYQFARAAAPPRGGRASCWPPARPTAAIAQPARSSTTMREAARQEPAAPKLYDGRWRDRDPEPSARPASSP